MARDRWLLLAFPPAWRERHAQEFLALLDEMRSEHGGRLTISHRVDVLLAGASMRMESHGRSRRFRAVLMASIVVACLAAAGALTGLLIGSGGGSGGVADASSLYPSPARVSPDAAMLDEFLPTSGAQVAAGEEYREFVNLAEGHDTNRCLVAKEMAPMPVRLLTYAGDNVQFPDIAYLARNGFTGAVAPASQGTAGRSSSQTPTEKATERSCWLASSAAFNALSNQENPLFAAWVDIAAKVDTDAVFKAALRGFSSCLAATGIHTTTITGFFHYATPESRLAATSTAEGHSLAALYARCLDPAEAVRDRLRAAARAKFVRSHSGAIVQLTHDWNGLVTRAERAGTPWPSW